MGKLPKEKCPITRIDFPGRRADFSQYSRLTLVMDNPQHNLGINPSNEIIRSYDFVAIQPENEKMFQVACTNLDVDMISLDFGQRLAFPLRPGYINVARSKGMVFEIQYSPMIRDSSARRHTLSNAQQLLRSLKGGKDVIVSSGATAAWQIRAPSDVASLAGLFGMASHLRKAALTLHPHAAFMNAATRKHTFRGAGMVLPTEEQCQADDMLDDFIKF